MAESAIKIGINNYFAESKFYLAILAVIVIVYTYLAYSMAYSFEQMELSRPGARGYVSDEVWYVNAARNIMRKIFSLAPRMDTPRATLIYGSADDKKNALNLLFQQHDVKPLRTDFSKIEAIYVEGSSIDAILRFANETRAVDVIFGWVIGDNEFINGYLNLEHPPLAKYIIGLSIVLLGDRPLYWRIPSIIFGLISVILTYMLAAELTKSKDVAILSSALLVADPLFRLMSSIALLDIFVVPFTLGALLLAKRGRFREAVLITAVGACFKFTALFAFIPVLAFALSQGIKNGRSAADLVLDAIYYVLLMALSFIFMMILTSTPIALRIGVGEWFKQGVTGAMSWHLTTKCVGQNCPPASAPWDWLLGLNSFPIYIKNSGEVIQAQGLTPVYLTSFALLLLFLPTLFRVYPYKSSAMALVGVFSGYVLLWILGNRSQYSFYAVQLSPLISIFFIGHLYYILRRENLSPVYNDDWAAFFRHVWTLIERLLAGM